MNGRIVIVLVYAVVLWCLELICSRQLSVNLALETFVHGFTGAFFWICNYTSLSLIVIDRTPNLYIVESCLWSVFFSIIPDVDHFIVARSLRIEDARNLPGRPFLHWAGFIIAFLILLVLISVLMTFIHLEYFILNYVMAISWLILISFTSHVIRDSTHRGLWLWPPPNFKTGMLDPMIPAINLFNFSNYNSNRLSIRHVMIYLLSLGILIPNFVFSANKCQLHLYHFSPFLIILNKIGNFVTI